MRWNNNSCRVVRVSQDKSRRPITSTIAITTASLLDSRAAASAEAGKRQELQPQAKITVVVAVVVATVALGGVLI